ncbi:MAG: TrkA family potassium uptake protein [Bacillota bacterium]|nr:TrkA family potassium uptake protein [Bacillota bacterium]
MADKHKKQYIVFGVGRFGSALARKLCELGHEVLAVDSSEERVNAISPYVTTAVQASSSDEEAVRSLGIRNFDAAIVAIGDNFHHSILTTLMCQQEGAPYIIAKASDAMHAKVLMKLGVNRVIFPERDMGERVALSLVSPHVLDLINLKGDYLIAYITCPDSWKGRSLKELDIRNRYHVSILAIYRGEDILMNLNADARFDKGDNLLILGSKQNIEKVEGLG